MILVVDGHDTVDAMGISPSVVLEATGGSDTRYAVIKGHRLKRICFRAAEHVLAEASTAVAISYLDSELLSAPTVFCIYCFRHGNAPRQQAGGTRR